ncbi:MAG: hypothetical protein HZB26_09175 [Candidatus Hydrogenedentes bacterium]|nr:hypothetical protein [Candidatus Hydrogenedentota bacterium]
MTTSQPNFDLGGLFGRAWKLYTENVAVLLGGMLIIIAINFALGMIPVLGAFAGVVITGPLLLGYYFAVLKVLRGQGAAVGDVFSGFQNFLPGFLAYLIITIFTVIGTMLCVLPGLFVQMIYCLTYIFIVDRKQDFWPAMESSRQTVMAAMGSWIVLYLVIIGINIAGALACGVGLLVSGPISALILAMAYEQVSGPTIQASAT